MDASIKMRLVISGAPSASRNETPRRNRTGGLLLVTAVCPSLMNDMPSTSDFVFVFPWVYAISIHCGLKRLELSADRFHCYRDCIGVESRLYLH